MTMLDGSSPPASSGIYGTHLMLRLGEIEKPAALDAPEGVASFLEDLVLGIGMRILAGPHVDTEVADPDRYGHSGVILLHESHAAIHTYPNLRALFLDVFSCKAFEAAEVVRLTEDAFGKFKILESTVLDRGHHWSADADTELARWHEAR